MMGSNRQAAADSDVFSSPSAIVESSTTTRQSFQRKPQQQAHTQTIECRTPPCRIYTTSSSLPPPNLPARSFPSLSEGVVLSAPRLPISLTTRTQKFRLSPRSSSALPLMDSC